MKQEVVDVGYVLKTRDYKDNDKMVIVYFKNYGKMTVLARGVKKIKSKNAIACLPNHVIEFTFIPRIGISTLIKATSLKRYKYIEEDFILQVYTSYFQEFLYRHEEENKPNQAHYDFLEGLHERLNQGYQPYLLYALTNAYILKTVGSSIQVDECVICRDKRSIVGISIQHGGFVCQHCISERDYFYDKELLKCFRRINKADLSHLDLLDFPGDMIIEINKVLEGFIDEYIGIVFQSRKFM